jgi:hypothetical protein
VPVWTPAAILLLGAAGMVVLLLLSLDRRDWREAAPLILWRAAFLIALGLGLGAFLILAGR